MAITKDMTIAAVLKGGNVEAKAEVLYNFGMHCLGCALATGETIEQAAEVHNIDVEILLKALLDADKK